MAGWFVRFTLPAMPGWMQTESVEAGSSAAAESLVGAKYPAATVHGAMQREADQVMPSPARTEAREFGKYPH